MHTITLISTVHEETGNCTADKLFKIIEKLSPEVIFLEADNESYSDYQHLLFSAYGQYHRRLEIAAIQMYDEAIAHFKYVPVCENSLTDALKRKNSIVCHNSERQKLVNDFKFLAETYGFKFLNSNESISLSEDIRVLERGILNGSDVDKMFEAAIDAYENPMIRNIYSYCNNNHFSSAIFLCGAAHRKSIIEKIKRTKTEDQVNVTWTIFEG